MELVIPIGTQTPPTTAIYLDGVYYLPLMVDASGRLIVVGIGSGGAIEVIQDTPADLKAAVHGIEGATQRQILVDSSGRLITVGIGAGGAVEVIQDTPADLKAAVHGLSGSTQVQLAVNASGQLVIVGTGGGGAIEAIQDTPADFKTAVHGLDGTTQRQLVADGSGRIVVAPPRERSGASIADFYQDNNLAPHADTTRFTYTVAAGKRAIVELLDINLFRNVAASSAGLAGAYFEVQPSGGSFANVFRVEFLDNTANYRVKDSLAPQLWLFAGDAIRARTYDGSTLGGVRYYVSYKLTLFTA